MNSEQRLARAIYGLVERRLSRNFGFVWVPDLANPMPLPELVALFERRGGIRLALLVDQSVPASLPASTIDITDSVDVAIDWRNEGDPRPLVVVGDLERDRAAGLRDIPSISISELRSAVFDDLISDLGSQAIPSALLKLLRAFKGLKYLTDVRACAGYSSVLATGESGAAQIARKELWRLGLLPDSHAVDIDAKRLHSNFSTVGKLRGMDASTRQRLIKHLTASQDVSRGDYRALRLFANTGQVAYLAELDLEDVQKALRSTTQKKKKNIVPGNGSVPADDNDLIAILQSNDYDEKALLSQLDTAEGSLEDNSEVRLGEHRLAWQFDNLETCMPLMADSGSDDGYDMQSGSVERFRDDDVPARPGTGDLEWRSLSKIADDLRTLERRRAGREVPECAEAVERLIGLRRDLLPYLPTLLTEGVRAFALSSTLRLTAEGMIACWIDLWSKLESLRRHLPETDHFYVRKIAENLSLCDLRVIVQRGDISVLVLPLHPIVVEPRLRAAELIRKSDSLTDDFMDLIVGSLDPGLPSLSVPLDGTQVSVAYSGKYHGLPQYSRNPRQVDTAETVELLRSIVQRFITVHPYAELSLSVGLLDPPPAAVRKFLRWLGEETAERVSLHVYLSDGDAEEVQAALDDAAEELVGGEIPAASFSYEVHENIRLRDLARWLAEEDSPPHLLFMFDVGEVEAARQGGPVGMPVLGSLISEWVFDTDPLEDSRPVIRPRTGFSQLNKLVATQAGLFNSQVPSQQRSPLLSGEAEAAISELAGQTTWLVLCEGMSAMVPSPNIGEMQLVGRIASGHVASFIYSAQVELLVEPVLTYLLNSTWLQPDGGTVINFLLGSVRAAVPEGLLGFFKTQGVLSRESVLGRLGFAAAIAYLNEASDNQLVVSLDTDGARRWLGLRDGTGRRADLLVVRRTEKGWSVDAVEVKARSGGVKWSGNIPEVVQEAVDQASEISRLLEQIFAVAGGDSFTPSRREILKRQVFMEALHQWEPIRRLDPEDYDQKIQGLNALFRQGSTVTIARRVFLVNPNQEGPVEQRELQDGRGLVSILSLGVPWLREALESRPGVHIEIPAELLDQLGVSSTSVVSPSARELHGVDAAAGASDAPTSLTRDDAGEEIPNEGLVLAHRLRDAFAARNAPFRAIEEDKLVLGPAIVQIPFSVPAGAKLGVIQAQEQDLSRDLGVQALRITNWSGHPGFAVAELPRGKREIPDVASLARPPDLPYPALALGAEVDFRPHWVSLDQLPHLLIGGTTGSGKSVFVRSLLWQLTKLYSADEVELVLIDAKGMADYLDFMRAPHFRSERNFHLGADGALELVRDIVEVVLPERVARFREYAMSALERPSPVTVANLRMLLSDARAQGVNVPLRPLVIIIDEFAELVLGSAARKQFETLVTRFVQIARAVGGHLVAATQRPSTDIVSGVMKGNFSRVALRVQQNVDSRVILDEGGAESLLGRGDLLFKSSESGLQRLQGYSAIGPYAFLS
ncbi:FtsK/SpoIIIE domain-containing protein [Micromonospora sp. MA102]|uniref:FtsK/SpoIIIE domain-containing protein n=1 Tax=Micromonospora sp. MA102 TaxID=2952755 RepID=UPI0021C9B404|nr:FtsK/SpoIIIE domain-containing protein [Micromonospora sp. MA102]